MLQFSYLVEETATHLKTHLRTYFSLPSAERVALHRAWVLILISKSLVPVMSLPRLTSMIERSKPAGAQTISPRRLAELVDIAGHRTFGSTCLHRALALLVLLRRQSSPARLAIGVNQTSGFAAHAWVEADDSAEGGYARLWEYQL